MRKFLLTLASVIVGLSCMAGNTQKLSRVPAYEWADTDTVKYFVGAQSYTNGGKFDINGGDSKTYEMGVVRDGNRVVFTGLLDLYKADDWSPLHETPIEGVYDETAGTITFDANIVYTNVWGSYDGILKAVKEFQNDGTVADGDELSQLVFNVTPDFKTITNTTPFGCQYRYGWNERFKSFTATKEDPNDPAHLNKLSGDVIFKDTYPNMPLTQTISILNDGGQAAEYVLTLVQEDDAFSLKSSSGSVDPYAQGDFEIVFNPQFPGEFEAILTLETEDQTFTYNISGNAQAIPDYSAIVLNGDFTFETTIDYPAYIADVPHYEIEEYENEYGVKGVKIKEDADGNPIYETVTAAVMSTKGIYGMSTLKAKFTVPEGMMGKLSFKGFVYNPTNATYMLNTFVGFDTENAQLSGRLTGDFEPEFCYHEFAEGEHYVYIVNYDGQSRNEETRTFIWDLDLQIEEPVGYGPEIKKPEVFMGYGVVGKCEKIATVDVRNKGVEEMTIESVTSDNDEFKVSVPKGSAGLFETIQVPVEFTAKKAGNGVREANLTIVTNLGEVTAKVSAKVCDEPDYSTLVKEGAEYITFSVNEDLPFMIEEGKAYNITSMMPDNWETRSTLDFEVNVPEDYIARLQFKGHAWGTPSNMYVSEPFWDFGGVELAFAKKWMNIDGFIACFYDNDVEASDEYWKNMSDAGTDAMFSEYFTLPSGVNKGNFFYQQGGDNKWYGNDRLEISEIRVVLTYVGEEDGLNEILSDAVKVEFFDLQGNRLAGPEKGINVVRATTASGNVITKKVMNKF